LKQFWITWLATGLAFTFVYLCVCYLIRAGTFGAAMQAHFRKQPRLPVQIPVTTITGLVFPPFMLALLLYFASRVRRER
jgi:hypothetical protein